MSSSNVGQLVPASAFTYTVCLRARHPAMDLAVLTETLRLDPDHTWTAGEPRRSQSGAPLGGRHRDSYWSCTLPAGTLGAGLIPLEDFLRQQLAQLARHRELLRRVQSDGGEVSLLVELSAGSNLTLSSAMARRLAELDLQVEFQFAAD
ncbi:MAG TPA: DUF4279 domain-containing protein [Steroidobacteraceae bacterium]|nr:DUF4279 domain-containing protein [Steroidobacteraceae bacterium]